MQKRTLLLAAAVGASASCFLVPRDLAGRACASDGDCLDTFVCVDEVCVTAEGEGEGDASEGEGDVVGEGEGDVVGEGEGDVVGEGEGEGEGEVEPALRQTFRTPDPCESVGTLTLAGADRTVFNTDDGTISVSGVPVDLGARGIGFTVVGAGATAVGVFQLQGFELPSGGQIIVEGSHGFGLAVCGDLVIGGTINADGAGFAGGLGANAADDARDGGGPLANSGEGGVSRLDSVDFTGGGGGGGGGNGGFSKTAQTVSPTRAEGGQSANVVDPKKPEPFQPGGGGGGGGVRRDSGFTEVPAGGAGGGAIWLYATGRVSCTGGTLTARGKPGGDFGPNGVGGGGGGGAGGVVFVEANDVVLDDLCLVDVTGGAGGASSFFAGGPPGPFPDSFFPPSGQSGNEAGGGGGSGGRIGLHGRRINLDPAALGDFPIDIVNQEVGP